MRDVMHPLVWIPSPPWSISHCKIYHLDLQLVSFGCGTVSFSLLLPEDSQTKM